MRMRFQFLNGIPKIAEEVADHYAKQIFDQTFEQGHETTISGNHPEGIEASRVSLTTLPTSQFAPVLSAPHTAALDVILRRMEWKYGMGPSLLGGMTYPTEVRNAEARYSSQLPGTKLFSNTSVG